MSPYYPTIDQDLARARELLAKGAITPKDVASFPCLCEIPNSGTMEACPHCHPNGGTIFAADIFAAYKLLESFVDHITYLHQQQEASLHQIEQFERRQRYAKRLNDRAQATLQQIMQVMGPNLPKDVDYTSPANLSGLTYEFEEALRILKDAGITYQQRGRLRASRPNL